MAGYLAGCYLILLAGVIGNAAGKRHMGRKDAAGRDFFSDRERFAEILNVHLYHGNKVVTAEKLRVKQRNYPPLVNAYGEKSRDILMEDVWHKINYGIELETESDYSMPERIMVYDACEYEQQIRRIYRKHKEREDFGDYCEKKSRMKITDFLYPTSTIVLYLGEGHWRGRLKMSEMFQIPEQDEELTRTTIHDYGFVLVETDFVNPDDYCTDLREFFQAMQYRRDRNKLRHLLKSENYMNLRPETEQAIAVYLNVKRLLHVMKKEELSMCQAFEEIMEEERLIGKKEGRREGKREGKKEGRKEGKKEEKLLIAKRMHMEGLEEALIRKVTRCTKKEFAAAVGR